MKAKIDRTKKLVLYEKQKLQAIVQNSIELNAKISHVEDEITALNQRLEACHAATCGAVDVVSHRQTLVAKNGQLLRTIETKLEIKSNLETELENVRNALVEQKVNVEVMESLLADQQLKLKNLVEEQQNLELLDLATGKFLED